MQTNVHFLNRYTLKLPDGRKVRLPKQEDYTDVKLRIVPEIDPVDAERAHELVCAGLKRARNYRLQRGFKKAWAQSGLERRVRRTLKRKQLNRLMTFIAREIELGHVEVRVDGVLIDSTSILKFPAELVSRS